MAQEKTKREQTNSKEIDEINNMKYNTELHPIIGDIVYTPIKKNKYGKATVVEILSKTEVLVRYNGDLWKDKIKDLYYISGPESLWSLIWNAIWHG